MLAGSAETKDRCKVKLGFTRKSLRCISSKEALCKDFLPLKQLSVRAKQKIVYPVFLGRVSFVLSVNLSLGVNPIAIATNAHAEIPEKPDSIRLVQLSLGRRYLIVSRIGVKQSRQ